MTWGLVSGAGTLLFLKVIAVQIAFGEGVLKRKEAREKLARSRRAREVRDAEIIETELATAEDAA